MKIKLSIGDIEKIIQEKFNTKNNIEFLYEDKSVKTSFVKGVQLYRDVKVLAHIEIEIGDNFLMEKNND